MMGKILKDIVAMIKQHPEGIPLNKMAEVYNKTYKNSLTLASLGIKSLAQLVASSNGELVAIGKLVLHRSHHSQPGAKAGNKKGSEKTVGNGTLDESSAAVAQDNPRAKSRKKRRKLLLGSDCGPPEGAGFQIEPCSSRKSSTSDVPSSDHTPPLSLPGTSQPTKTLSNEQLLQGVRQVIKADRCTTFWHEAPSAQQGAATPNNPNKKEPEREQNTPSGSLSSCDFPELGAELKATKDQKWKLQEQPQKRASASVFRNGYHSQLREVHRANLQASEAMEENAEGLAGRRRDRELDMEMVNSLVEDVIRDLATDGQLVTKEKVISKVCILLQVPSLEAGRIKPWHVPSLKHLQYIMREINMFLESAEAVTAICTLYELGQSLAGLQDKQRYEELNLGPLCKLPLVHRMFNIDSNTKDDDIPQIETVDILRNLRIFRRKVNKPKVDLAEFMQYLSDQYSCASPYELGVRIHSVGLPIATLQKVCRCEHAYLERAQQVIQSELEEEVLERMRKVKRSVMEPAHGPVPFSSAGSLELRKKYTSMTAAEAVMVVFNNVGQVFSSRMKKGFLDFLLQVSGDRLATALFQLAICGGSLAAPQDLVAKDKPLKAAGKQGPEGKPAPALPSEAAVKQYLKGILSSQNSALTLAHVASLERKLNKHFQVKEFPALEQGTFLEFLVKHIQLLQDNAGCALSLGGGGSGGTDVLGCSFRPSRQDIFEFIKQCGADTSNSPDGLAHIEHAVSAHYGVLNIRDLGFGPLRLLADLVQRQRDMLGSGAPSWVYYEAALFAKHSSSAASVCEAVGLLGEVSQTQAQASLLSCPLLEDLGQWSQWELVFKPVYGPLKDFIERNAALPGNWDLAALEVSPGVLLRVTTATSDKLFSQSAMTLDPVGTAGHLVSMVVADGIANVPTALLANHMESSLAAAVAKEDLSQAVEDVSCGSAVAHFLLECLVRIPTRTCQALLQQVFLEPLSRVLGHARSKAVLLRAAKSDPRHLNRLHLLGIGLGITDWSRDFHSKLHYTPTAAVEQSKSNLVNSVSSSLSALNLSEDEYPEDTGKDSGVGQQAADSEKEAAPEEEESEEEQLYELASAVDDETRAAGGDSQSDADGSQGAEVADPDKEDKEEEEKEEEEEENPQRAVIENIRKSEFGIGEELNAAGQKLMRVQQERLGRSLDRLSTELYSKDAHFVLELIQNADDNSYPSEGSLVPALAFVVQRDCVTILNNETGFQEKNIRAICDVGRSTKGKHKYGYIGQKGIGFKSVFKVTDCPEIHSNGFHLRFDKTCGPMGYILPLWVEDERPLDMDALTQHSWTTKIHLPLRSESRQTRNLFHDVHPSLLLFLHRLRSISIYNQSEQRLVTMTRRDLSHNVLEVVHTEGTERWLVIKRMLQPGKIKEDVESTELALAFQLADGVTVGDVRFEPQKQPVFAFLPLRSFGFRFIVQGDFDIPSSREDVDRDSPWNQWLRSEVPQIFLQAMDVFTDHPEFSALSGLCHFLQFVPLPDEVLDFFKPVAGQIIQLLKGKAFLPTLSAAGNVVYKLPSQVAVCRDAVIRDVIGGEELDRHLSLAYLHPGLTPAPPMSLLAHLGVRHLRGADVTTVTTAMAKELLQAGDLHTDFGLSKLARLLVCNFRALEYGYGETDSILQTLRDLPIIPLADGRTVALSGEGVFFPMEKSSKKKKTTKNQSGPYAALYQDVSVVHPSLLSCKEPLESQQVRELLKKLGVHELEPQQLLEEHIYPALRSGSWKCKPEQVVVSYLVFIKQHSSSSSGWRTSDMEVPVLTSRGLLCPAQDRVHFSVEYGNIDLHQKLPGCDWVLLSPCYVETDGDVGGWRELLEALGVRDRLIIRSERRTLAATELASSPWSEESGLWPRELVQGGCVLDDYPSEEFHALATATLPAPCLLEQRRALLELLESNWDTGDQYSQYLTAQVVDGEGRQIRSTKSSFCHFLSQLEWVPAYRLLEDGSQRDEYLHPNSVYLVSPEVLGLLGNHVCYVNTQPSEFSRALGMRHSVSVDEMIGYLKKWSVWAEPEGEEERGSSEFTSTVQHVYNVYLYLHKNCSQGSLKELFHNTPAIFVENRRRNDDAWCSGQFFHLREVCWSDPTGMFARYTRLTRAPDSSVQEPRVLAPFYAPLEGMRDLFTRLLNVEPSPTMNQYVCLLEMICSSCPMPTAEVLQDVSVIYAMLAQKCKVPASGDQDYLEETQTNPSYCSTLKGMVSDKRVFPTKDNSWVTLARRPMIADNRELEKIFKPHQGVCLLQLPPPNKKTPAWSKPGAQGGAFSRDHGPSIPAFSEDDRALFLEICCVRRLSHCVTTESQTEFLRFCPTMQAQVRAVLPYVQRFLLHHEDLGALYPELLAAGIADTVKRLSYWQVGMLYIRYQLTMSDTEPPPVEMRDVVCLLKDKKELYIQKDHLAAKLDICRELVKLFCTESDHVKELMHFLSGLMTSLDDPAALKRFLQKEDVKELPDEEVPWEVPEPPKQEINVEKVLSRGSSLFSIPEQLANPRMEDGEQTLACWPPRASMSGTGSHRTGSRTDDNGVVEAVMKKWPPPAPPSDRDPDRPHVAAHRGSAAASASQGPSSEGDPALRAGDRHANQPASADKEHGHPTQPRSAGAAPPPEHSQQNGPHPVRSPGSSGAEHQTPAESKQSPPAPEPVEPDADSPAPNNNHTVREVVPLPSVFQGTEGVAEMQRPPLAMDSPLWNKAQRPQTALEDMELCCQRPSTVVLSDAFGDVAAIGSWGEQLVNSFLCHWRDSGVAGRPASVMWCNEHGESGQPYDFKLTYAPDVEAEQREEEEEGGAVAYVEVKSTLKRDKAFVYLSANELDFALRERQRYHLFRVYSAGDAQNVRLCRIQNLAQHLYTKDLELFLFV